MKNLAWPWKITVISVSYVLDEVQEIIILMKCNYSSHQRSQNKFFMNKLEVHKHVM